ncbi:hypothetical protein J1N35_023190 [Gossypium stocksii]|uniref:Uncharacterized protein n=1 Tax=Gossypium stocksii TaxID=47602 RepID=A0A9D3VJ52_9ROSI|nr:hypothetical protein J1N35_023190 [Gossypium stocksii]
MVRSTLIMPIVDIDIQQGGEVGGCLEVGSLVTSEELEKGIRDKEVKMMLKLHDTTHQTNGAFKPQIISIGPNHHGKPHLEAMESQKLHFLDSIIRQQPEGLEHYIDAYMSIEQFVWDSYAEHDQKERDKFRAIIVLDGLFVVQLFRKVKDPKLREENDALFKQNLNLSIVAQDLLLLENQLPFLVLERFGNMLGIHGATLIEEALTFFSETEPRQRMLDEDDLIPILFREEIIIRKDEHLLGLVHDYWIRRQPQPQPQPISESDPSHIIETLGLEETNSQTSLSEKRRQAEGSRKKSPVRKVKRRVPRLVIRSATELSERGIRFRKSSGSCLFNIQFERGILFIPTLIVDHDTERMFRNLIAYEQFKHDISIVMDYAKFLDCLINYADDVALLCDCGVIENRLGSNEDVAKMINKLNEYVYLCTENFHYSHIFNEVNKHCRQPLTLWKVTLRQKYFKVPWDWVFASISVATALLTLSFLQTIFSALSYFNQSAR